MKCPKCDAKHKVKYGMKCSYCSYVFIFNPKIDKLRMTDGKFKSIIKIASGNGTFHFTGNQMYIAAFKFYNKFSRLITFIAGIVVISIVSFILYSANAKFWIWFLAISAVLYIFYRALFVPRKISRLDWDRLVSKWVGSGKKIEKLIQKKSLQSPPPEWSESDIYDYGVEGILICQKSLYVDFLALNNFHTEHKLLIMSQMGHPDICLKQQIVYWTVKPIFPSTLFTIRSATGN